MSDSETQELDRATVLAWLQAHPDALQGEDELVRSLRFTAGDGRHIIGLQDYRQQQLHQDKQRLERELARFEQLVVDNEQLLHRLHQWVLRMLDAGSLEDLLQQVLQGLKLDFSAEMVALHVPRVPEDFTAPEGCLAREICEPAVINLAQMEAPRLGRLPDSQKEALFGPLAAEVQSAVILPMNTQGVLAVGSTDPLHYQAGMGTEMLSFASQCLMRLLRAHG